MVAMFSMHFQNSALIFSEILKLSRFNSFKEDNKVKFQSNSIQIEIRNVNNELVLTYYNLNLLFEENNTRI